MSSITFSREIIHQCCKLLSSFQPNKEGPDDHLGKFIKSDICQGLHETDKIFLLEVFAGCVQYESLIKVVVDGYYSSNEGGSSLHCDASLYQVVTYLMMFRLNELQMTSFKKLINSQHTVKMYKFLKFFLNQDNLKGWIMDEWLKLYDKDYIQRHVMDSLTKYEEQLKEYIQQLEDKVNNKQASSHTSKSNTTKTVPFNLTVPKARTVPSPEKIPSIQPHKPVPQSTYVTPVELETISMIRESQKMRAKEKVEESNVNQFTCAVTEKSMKTKNIMKQILEERESKLDYEPLKAKPVPVTMKEQRNTKLNAAAILREGARIQRVEEEEEKRLAYLVAGNRDDSEFIKRQEEMKQMEEAQKLAEQQKRHLEGQLSYEEAIIARQNLIHDTRERVAHIKEESRQFMDEYFKRREKERKEMRQLVESTMESHQGARDARIKLQKMKQRMVQEIAKEKQELLQKALEEEEKEMRRKVEIIQQIRTMESIPVIRVKHVDLTETGGQGLLAEMSIAELRERLTLMKIAEHEEQERKKKEIALAKESKEQLLNNTINAISKHNTTKSDKKTINLEKQTETQQKHITSSHNDVVVLQKKLEMKKKEREKLKESSFNGGTSSPHKKVKDEQISAMEVLMRATKCELTN